MRRRLVPMDTVGRGPDFVAGGVVGSLGMVGLVWSQTQAPETNPASQPALVYGD